MVFPNDPAGPLLGVFPHSEQPESEELGRSSHQLSLVLVRCGTVHLSSQSGEGVSTRAVMGPAWRCQEGKPMCSGVPCLQNTQKGKPRRRWGKGQWRVSTNGNRIENQNYPNTLFERQKDRERERENERIFPPLVYCLNSPNSQGSRISRVDNRDPGTCCLLGCTLVENWNQKGSWALNPVTSTWDAGAQAGWSCRS